MVEDLIKRLRNWRDMHLSGLAREAADLIEQQAARLTALESERDALLAAAGKEAVAEPVTHETIFSEVTKWVDAHHISFEAQNELFKALSGVLANAAPNPWEALFDRVALELNCLPSSFADGNEHVFQAIEKLRIAPTAALENGDGRDAWLLTLYELLMQQNIVTSGESYLSLRCVGVPPTEAEFATAVQRAIDAALSQKAGEQQ
ncbi:hypothetical protein [Paraburkholderia graminis]|uniref:hypothetical protein n=1 Tax=Paraburkholderia graminis TaxID=60548 RepID=UPI0038BBC6E7